MRARDELDHEQTGIHNKMFSYMLLTLRIV